LQISGFEDNYPLFFALMKFNQLNSVNFGLISGKPTNMKTTALKIVFLLFCFNAYTQRAFVGVFGGLAGYNGDLTSGIFPKKVTNGAFGITASYELTDNIFVRAGYSYAIVGGADRFNSDPGLVSRNLSFETQIREFSLLGEYYLINLYDKKISPYGFAGLAYFKFNPYAYDAGKNKIFLQPLGTEGQGIAGYTAKPYKLSQLAIPFGGGVKFAITNDIRIGIEFGLRKLFTDYLDDLSGNYADLNDLLTANGALSVAMSYRADELVTGNPAYPAKGAQRGSSLVKDYYYFTGIHFTFRFGGEGSETSLKKYRLGCPSSPL
jgi:opacity protein-like surface antigen